MIASEENVTVEPEPLPEIEKIEPVEVEEERDVPEPLPNWIVRFINWLKSLFS